jgi:hypothetical protein
MFYAVCGKHIINSTLKFLRKGNGRKGKFRPAQINQKVGMTHIRLNSPLRQSTSVDKQVVKARSCELFWLREYSIAAKRDEKNCASAAKIKDSGQSTGESIEID